jgi:hypothetical protein
LGLSSFLIAFVLFELDTPAFITELLEGINILLFRLFLNNIFRLSGPCGYVLVSTGNIDRAQDNSTTKTIIASANSSLFCMSSGSAIGWRLLLLPLLLPFLGTMAFAFE